MKSFRNSDQEGTVSINILKYSLLRLIVTFSKQEIDPNAVAYIFPYFGLCFLQRDIHIPNKGIYGALFGSIVSNLDLTRLFLM